MKLEWGKKVCCPACSQCFYDMQKQSLVCPYCGEAFPSSASSAKKKVGIVAEKIGLPDEGLASFGFETESDIDLAYVADEMDELGAAIKKEVEPEQEN